MTEELDPQKWVSDGPTSDRDDTPSGPDQQVGSEPVPLSNTTVRLDDDTRAFLAAEAKRLGISESEVVRQGLTFWRGYLAHQRGEASSGAESTRTEE